jgi:hypothetical protein
MGVYQEARLDIAIPAAAVAPITEAILGNENWAEVNLKGFIAREPELAMVEFLVCAEGGMPSDVDYDVDPDTGEICITTWVDGKLGWDAEQIEALYAKHGATGIIDGVCEGEKFRARFTDGKVLRSEGETFYTEDRNDPASVAVDAALEFIRGKIDEKAVLAALVKAKELNSENA